ncbi:MAG: hypothetical protein ABGW69_00615 [Nanoarchaeota archaeon]
MSDKKEESGLGIGVVVMIMGAIFFLFTLFTEEPQQGIDFLKKNNYIELPSVKLSSNEKIKELIFNVPYIYLEGDGAEKDYNVNLNDRYDFLEAYYQIEEDDNAILGVYFNDYLVSFNKNGNNYYKVIDKSIYGNSNELNIRFLIKKKSNWLIFSTPKVVIKDFVIYGYKGLNKATFNFYLNNVTSNLVLKGTNRECSNADLFLKINNCPEYEIKLGCFEELTYNIPEICLKIGNNTISFRLYSGKVDLENLRIEKARFTNQSY